MRARGGVLRRTRSGISRVWVIVLAVVLVALAIAGTWVANTFFWFGRHPPRVDFDARWREVQRAGMVGEPNEEAWSTFDEIVKHLIETERAVAGRDPVQADGSLAWWIDLSASLNETATAADREAAFRALEELRRRGVPELLDRIAANPNGYRKVEPGDFFVSGTSDQTAARAMTRALRTWFMMAWVSGDDSELIRVARQWHGLAALVGRQPTVRDRLIGSAISLVLAADVCDHFRKRSIDTGTIRDILDVFNEPKLPPLHVSLEGERVVTLARIDAQMADGRLTATSRGAQIEKVNEYFDLAIEYAQDPPGRRSPELAAEIEALVSQLDRQYPIASLIVPALQVFIRGDDQWISGNNGLRVAVAVELYFREQGRMPASLAELTPEILPELPEDPYSPDGFRYRPDPKLPRGYLLYTVGFDRTDDGGRPNQRFDMDAFTEKGAGTDYVFVGSEEK